MNDVENTLDVTPFWATAYLNEIFEKAPFLRDLVSLSRTPFKPH